ncbi:hypothetical protein CEXT_542981 [Caerostris extrusa]|uniref:Uncharacterized protein n=1 Tax=Caerostris extrusa TaxID=172846 RepID=A0AAV4Y3G2_CAEEX|nr:hypothetical protein CEXT_542981 [Caerostris extrusa]
MPPQDKPEVRDTKRPDHADDDHHADPGRRCSAEVLNYFLFPHFKQPSPHFKFHSTVTGSVSTRISKPYDVFQKVIPTAPDKRRLAHETYTWAPEIGDGCFVFGIRIPRTGFNPCHPPKMTRLLLNSSLGHQGGLLLSCKEGFWALCMDVVMLRTDGIKLSSESSSYQVKILYVKLEKR